MARTDILLFVEDPSAANYAALLLPVFTLQGWSARLYASAVACSWLHSRSVEFIPIAVGADAVSLLREVNPRCVLTGTAENPETFGLRLIDAARGMRIPAVAFVDALMSAAYRFRGTTEDSLAHPPGWLLVPDDKTLEAFTGLGYPRNQTFVCGHPQYDQTRAVAAQWAGQGGPSAMRQRLFPEVEPGRKIIVFVSEGAPRFGQMPKRVFADFGFEGRGADRGRTRIILEEVLDALAELPNPPYVLFRAHPTEHIDDYDEYRPGIDRISSDGSPLEVVYSADLVIGMTSMLLLEAALLGRPTLAVLAEDAEVELLASVRSGMTPHVLNRAGLRNVLPALLGGNAALAVPEGASLLVSGAAERVVRVLASLVAPIREQGNRI